MPRSASDEIREAIAAAGGSLRFDRFMDLALYGAAGFYRVAGRAGRRGDFITSPEVGPLFGAVVARWLDALWTELGEPEAFTLIEAGAGPGTLARSIRAAAPRCLDSMRYVAVEVSAEQRQLHPEWVESADTMPNASIVGAVVANELLDNLAFRLFVMDGGWRECHVVAERDGRFAEVLVEADDLPALLPANASLGARVAVQQRAGQWVTDALAMIERGRLLVFDYSSPTTAAMAAQPWRQWLRTYRGHTPGSHYLLDPGAQDITADVALDQLFASVGDPDSVRSQRQFLMRWGIDDLVDEGRRVWDQRAARPDVAAMTMRSRIREAEALCDPGGLGGFAAIEFSRA